MTAKYRDSAVKSVKESRFEGGVFCQSYKFIRFFAIIPIRKYTRYQK